MQMTGVRVQPCGPGPFTRRDTQASEMGFVGGQEDYRGLGCRLV